jgi:serine/threonine protein kinase
MTDARTRLAAALADRYRIMRELGAGGMATVYLAEDLKHDRKVAIKVLKPELAAVLGAERFVQEIKTTAALSHPHILPLFDSGEAGGFLYYVMPYIQGETIREKLNRETQFGIDDTVRIVTEVADALDYAHRHGVIHRDIKPENILLHDGRPMVMDFGIALAVSAAAGGRMTETGLSLGTPHYMSPEQATADKQITARSDIYSLASVCYEMLTGEPPHMGTSAQQIIMKIVTEDAAPVTRLRKSVPPNVAAAVAKALEKLPADRFDSARAFADALNDRTFTTISTAGLPSDSRGSLRQWWRSPYSRTAGAILVVGAGALAALILQTAPPLAVGSVVATSLIDSITSPWVGVALADDGTIVIARDGKLYARLPGELGETVLTATDSVETGGSPVISPNGADLVYTAVTGSGTARRSHLRRISLRGGTASTLWTAPDERTDGTALAWGEDGAILVRLWRGSVSASMLGRLSASGGTIDSIAANLWNSAELLPGGKGLVGCLINSPGTWGIVGVNLSSGDTVRVLPDTCEVHWSPTGHLLRVAPGGTLEALPFDPDRFTVTGPPIPVRTGLQRTPIGNSTFALNRTGTLLYVAGPASDAPGGFARQMALVGLDGQVSTIPLPPTDRIGGAFSPDGRQLAYERSDQIWIYDLDLGTHRQFTTEGRANHSPVWSPDGTRLAYRSQPSAARDGGIYVQSLTGNSTGARIGDGTPTQWLADGTVLSNTSAEGSTARDIIAFNADRPGEGKPVLHAPWDEAGAQVSPDGKWLAYQSDESGRSQILVRAWPSLDRKTILVDSTLNWRFSWSPDGQTVYYIDAPPFRLMAVSLVGTDSLRVASRRVAIATPGGPPSLAHPDGRRFLVHLDRGDRTARQLARRSLIVVAGWITELREKISAAEVR